MAKKIEERDLQAVETAVRRRPGGATAREIADELGPALPHRTLQYRLKQLVGKNRLVVTGKGRWARYGIPRIEKATGTANARSETKASGAWLGISKAEIEIQDALRQPPEARTPVGYRRAFLDTYRPNQTFYLSQSERQHLLTAGMPKTGKQPAGTYARQILNRLLVDRGTRAGLRATPIRSSIPIACSNSARRRKARNAARRR